MKHPCYLLSDVLYCNVGSWESWRYAYTAPPEKYWWLRSGWWQQCGSVVNIDNFISVGIIFSGIHQSQTTLLRNDNTRIIDNTNCFFWVDNKAVPAVYYRIGDFFGDTDQPTLPCWHSGIGKHGLKGFLHSNTKKMKSLIREDLWKSLSLLVFYLVDKMGIPSSSRADLLEQITYPVSFGV